jgi:hypothetical protein
MAYALFSALNKVYTERIFTFGNIPNVGVLTPHTPAQTTWSHTQAHEVFIGTSGKRLTLF